MTSKQFPRIKIINLKPDSIRLKLENCNNSIANALRRIIISELPCLAFDSAQIKVNDSFISDEMLAHRLGLVPLHCEYAEDFNIVEECNCPSSCPKCCVPFSLKISANHKGKVVYSTDIINMSDPKDLGARVVPADSELSTEKKKTNEKLIIAKLGPYQKLDIDLIARKGIGREHGKWQLAFVKLNYDDNEKFNTSRNEKQLHSISNLPKDFEMEIESIGQMDPVIIFKKALKMLYNKIDLIETEFKKVYDLHEDF